jgi:hypothetical protein
MRKTLLIAAVVVLAFAGVATARSKPVSYKTGTYTAGSSSKTGVNLKINRGSFSVSRISFRETCTSANDSFSDRFTFVKGSNAKLTGTINRRGHFSGKYESGGSTVKVTGNVKGSTATVTGTESGPYTPPGSTTEYSCKGSHTFTAKRLVLTGGR